MGLTAQRHRRRLRHVSLIQLPLVQWHSKRKIYVSSLKWPLPKLILKGSVCLMREKKETEARVIPSKAIKIYNHKWMYYQWDRKRWRCVPFLQMQLYQWHESNRNESELQVPLSVRIRSSNEREEENWARSHVSIVCMFQNLIVDLMCLFIIMPEILFL